MRWSSLLPLPLAACALPWASEADAPRAVSTPPRSPRISVLNPDLCVKAEDIVIATVIERAYRALPDHQGMIVTDVRLAVDRRVSGTDAPDIEVTVLGGTLGGSTAVVGGEPRMLEGTTWLLFLRALEEGAGNGALAARWVTTPSVPALPSATQLTQAWSALCRRHPEGVGPHTWLSTEELLDAAAEAHIPVPARPFAMLDDTIWTLDAPRNP